MSDTGLSPKTGWIVALVGMLVIPLGGLVWAATSGGGADETETTESDVGAEGADETSTGSGSKTKAKKKKKKKAPKAATARGARKVTHEAAACCAALRTAGQEMEDISKRPTFLAAASACEAAPTAARAKTQVSSIVEGSRLELPPECEAD